jgi:hypothetical protein
MSEEIVAPTTRTIFLTRIINGNKVKWKFEVNEEMVILSEGPLDPMHMINSRRPPLPFEGRKQVPETIEAQRAQHIERYKQSLSERNIDYNVNEQGQIIINNLPQKEKDIVQFFNLDLECPDVKGMNLLRDMYRKEYETLGGTSCPSCQLGSLQRKYRHLLDKDIYMPLNVPTINTVY